MARFTLLKRQTYQSAKNAESREIEHCRDRVCQEESISDLQTKRMKVIRSSVRGFGHKLSGLKARRIEAFSRSATSARKRLICKPSAGQARFKSVSDNTALIEHALVAELGCCQPKQSFTMASLLKNDRHTKSLNQYHSHQLAVI
ncbi:hypothetical protein MRB53_040631 [Persea americana]|nr:hypothetical protein MRB53_040631 [Persea americana]